MANSTFFGIEIGKRALMAFRKGMDVSGHNVSNAKSASYHRQSAVLQATAPYPMPSTTNEVGCYMIGSGVEVSTIMRYVDASVETRIRSFQGSHEYNSAMLEYLKQLESMETMKTQTISDLNEFFGAFQDLSNAPESVTVRSVVIQKAELLSSDISLLASNINTMRSEADTNVQATIDDVNSLLEQIRDVNVLTAEVSAAGNDPNDLMDQRDGLLGDLAKLVDFQIQENSNNSITLFIGGRAVVQDKEFLNLVGVADPANSNFVDVKYADDPAGADVPLMDGKLKGLLDVRDSTTSGLFYYKQQLDSFATNFINAVNTQHALGFDLAGAAGGDFFTAPGVEPALNMSVDALISDPLNGPGRVAAASAAASVPGDGSNALALAQLQSSAIIGAYTPTTFFSNLISNLGINVNGITQQDASTEAMLEEVQNIRDSFSAVSLDEEATLLVEYQNAYAAAAKLITMYQDTYDVLLGLVG